MIYADTYTDSVVNLLLGQDLPELVSAENGCVNTILQDMAILHIPRREDYLNNLERTPYAFIPKLYGLMDSSNIEAIGVKTVQNPAGVGLTGRGVLVAVIDTGIDYTNPLFRNADGSTRIAAIWDQTIEGSGQPEQETAVYYGTVYTREQIDAAFMTEDPAKIVPTEDTDGHGTFLAGIAAGGADRSNDFVGIAPQAQLIVVKLKQAKPYLRRYFGVPDTVPAYEETDLIYAMDYVLRFALSKRMPVSVLTGLGTSSGGHMAQTALERYLDSVLKNVGLMVSVPAGNEGNARLHYQGVLAAGQREERVEIQVAQGQNTLVCEFWGERPATFAIGLISPQGDRIERVPPRFGAEERLRLPLSGTDVYIAYQLVEVYSGNELIFIRLQNPIPGIWQVLVYNEEENESRFHMWMPLRQFLQPSTYFLRADPENTITAPGNAHSVMTMTAYNHLNGSIYSNAGRGYRANGETKPDLAAPGVDISGPGLRNNYVRKTGTSVAAAHSAGCMALFLEWNLRNQELGVFYPNQIQSIFRQQAERMPDMTYPNPVWGYGVMNMERVLDGFRVTERNAGGSAI